VVYEGKIIMISTEPGKQPYQLLKSGV